jgi:hypothetical protein
VAPSTVTRELAWLDRGLLPFRHASKPMTMKVQSLVSNDGRWWTTGTGRAFTWRLINVHLTAR